MSNLDSSNAATEPRSGLAGVTGVGGVVWGSLRATFSRIGENISFWSVVGVTVILSTLYYCVFAESMYDSQAILSIQNKGASAGGAASILGSALGSSGSSSQQAQINDYIDSMEMLHILDAKYHLRALYRAPDRNPFWRLYLADIDENFLWFYQHMVAVDSDTDAGTMTIDVYDYDRNRAHEIAQTISLASEKFINDMNTKMQQQTMLFARGELSNAVKAVQDAKTTQDQAVAEMRLSAAQQALASVEGAANQQTIFLVPISAASVPTETTEPQRLFNIITITVITAIIYAVGFLMWSNVRDHRKA